MLLSLALIIIAGMLASKACSLLRLPSLIGMLAAGILLGPYVANLIDDSILNISADIRKVALIVILIRAGLGLDMSGLKKIGRPALLMCFLPACFEIGAIVLIGPKLLGLSYSEAAVLGAVLAAVSPAVVVPRMVRLTDEGYGMDKGIPQLILAGASVDDVFVIVMFTTFCRIEAGTGGVDILDFVNIPFSIVTGIVIGYSIGLVLTLLWEKLHMRDTVKLLMVMGISLLLVVAEDSIPTTLNFSSLIAVMFIGIGIKQKAPVRSKRLALKFSKAWVVAEIFLFVLVGACVNINYVGKAGFAAVALILGALVIRMLGVLTCLIKTKLNLKERVFTMMAYTPKATVQAAIGGVPLAMGLACGDVVLTCAVMAIIITAPIGAAAIDLSYKRLLQKK